MTKEEMAKSYSDGFDNEIYKEIAYNAFLCGFTAKCEPSLPSNLDEAAEKYAWMKEEPLSDGERLSFCFNPRIDAFKAGAEWRDAQIPKLPNSIDEAAEKYAIQGHENHTNVNYINTYIEGKRIGFKAGAEWMVQQGYSQEEIVEDKSIEVGYGTLSGISPIINLPDSFKPGSKVIVQIRKKEE